jgi:hypothetical protein
MEETSKEDSEDQRKKKTIWTYQIIISKPSKSNKSVGYEQIFKPWLYSFIVIGLWGK